MELTRRRLVGAGSLATVSALAGCLADGTSPGSGTGNGDDGNGAENGTDDENGNGDDDTEGNGSGTEDGSDGNDGEPGDSDGGSDADEGGETDTVAAGDGYDSLAFSTSSVPETDADPFYSEDGARSALPLDDWREGTRERVESFLEDTDFDSSVIVALRTRAPSECYEFVVLEAGIDDGGVSVRAAATDDDARGACAQVENGLWLLVRLTTDGDVPDEGNVTILEADGTEAGFGYARESASASEGGGSSSSGNSTDGDERSRLGFRSGR